MIFDQEKTLFVGAHPDDVAISSAITISRNPNKSYVFTITTGANPFVENYPMERPLGKTHLSPAEYAAERIAEDKAAMKLIRLPEDHYICLGLDGQTSYLHASQIIEELNAFIERHNIKIIVTHEFPQSHPDHEVASVCAHLIGKRRGIPVFEFPLYYIDTKGRRVNCTFGPGNTFPKKETVFTSAEFRLKRKILEIYRSQRNLIEMYLKRKEVFALVTRDVSQLREDVSYVSAIKAINPQLVREALRKLQKRK